MKKLLLIILLTIFSNGVMAEWTAISEGNKHTSYADKASISRKGNIAKMWVLMNYVSPQDNGGDTYLSTVGYEEHDCANKMFNVLSINNYSENMGKGNAVTFNKYDAKNWNYTPPNTVLESRWKIACGKK